MEELNATASLPTQTDLYQRVHVESSWRGVMADPLSIAGSIAGLVSLAIQLSQVSFQYVSSVTGSSKAWSSYVQELSALTSVLLKLQQSTDHVGGQGLPHILQTAGVSAAAVQECHKELDSLKTTLSTRLAKKGLRRRLDMLTWPFSEPETEKKIKVLNRYSSLFEASLVADTLSISLESYLHLKDEKDVRSFNDMLEWYKPKYETLPLSPEDVLDEMCPGTWSDLLSSAPYVSWRGTVAPRTQGALWINGVPGAGKTVLAAAVVDDIASQSDTIVATHFFRDDNEETLLDVFRHIVYQILSQPATISQLADSIYKKKKARNASLLSKDLVDIICDVSAKHGNVYIVVDGLDEFPQYSKLLKHLPQFLANDVKVIVSSRDLPTIAAQLTNATPLHASVGQHDVALYVDWRLEEESEIEQGLLTDDLKVEIGDKVLKQAKDSFLLARLIMDTVCSATTPRKIRNALDTMPTSYEEAYKSTLERILKQDEGRRTLALSAFVWIGNSRRPLDTTELQYAIASLDEAPEYTPDSLEPVTAILSSTFGLLVHSASTQNVTFVHLTARKFILDQLGSHIENTSLTLGRACLRYMAVPEMTRGVCTTLDELKIRITELPFLEYAARHYGYHVRLAENELLAELRDFLDNKQYRGSSWQLLHFVVEIQSLSAQDSIACVPGQPTMLHVCCYWGFPALAQSLLVTPAGLAMSETADSHGWLPLHWAASNGHIQLVVELIDAGANINVTDKVSWTPLFWAVVRGHGTVVQLLLDRGCSPFEQDQNGFTALHWAILAGSHDIMDVLVEYMNHAPRPMSIEFESASSINQLTVEAAKVTEEPKQVQNLFHLAADLSDSESFKTLVGAYDCHLHLEDFGLDAEQVSALWNQTRVAISKREDRFQSRQRATIPIDVAAKQLLIFAIRYEDVKLVESILSLGRDLGKDLATEHISAIHEAACCHNPDIIDLLIQGGFSKTATDSWSMTPLHCACARGRRAVVELLLQSSVSADARDRDGRTPLMLLLGNARAEIYHEPGDIRAMLSSLIANGASVQAQDLEGNQHIHFAMATRDADIVQILMDHGADLRAVSNNLWTPLHTLARGADGLRYDHKYRSSSSSFLIPAQLLAGIDERFAKWMLQNCPSDLLQAETSTSETALALAIRHGQWILAQALHAAVAPFRCNDNLSDMLETISDYGFYELTRILVNAGANLKSANHISRLSAMLPAKKPHSWEWQMLDISHSDALPRCNHALVLKELVATGANFNEKHSYLQCTPIHITAEKGINNVHYLIALLDGGADPYIMRDDGLDAFHLALLCGKLENLAIFVQHALRDISRDYWLTNYLRESGATLDEDQDAFSVCIAALDHSGLCRMLDRNGHTLLFHAVSEGNFTLARELVKLGADVSIGDSFGWTSFHEAIRTNKADMARWLLDEGSDAQWTVVSTAPFAASASVAPDPDEPVPYINALHIAVGIHSNRWSLEGSAKISTDIVRLLLERGLDPSAKATNIPNLRGFGDRIDASPLQIMFQRDSTDTPEFFEIVQMLVDHGADVRGVVDDLMVYQVAKFEGYERLWEILRDAGPMT